MSLSKYAHDVLRIGLSVLFLWFGMSQLLAPHEWVSWLPSWATSPPIPLPPSITPEQMVLINGGFQTILGSLIALGMLVRFSALLLALHMFVIAFESGYGPTGVRDLSLAVCTLALALFPTETMGQAGAQARPALPKPLF